MKFLSYAKINLGLRVLRKRSDGYHDIETFFQQIDLHDILDIEPAHDGEIRLIVPDQSCPTDHTNLAYRAADLLRTKVGNAALGCRIYIDKRIPIGAGLGGGSSNAATTLVALNEMWGSSLTKQELMNDAANLGSDVPFFIQGGFALGESRGEVLTLIPIKMEYLGVLVYPNIEISTAWVYNNLNLVLTKKNKIANFSGFIPRINRIFSWKEKLENDLTTVVFKKYPELSHVLEKFYEMGAFFAQMSGSGSSLFGLFEKEEQASKAEKFFRTKYDTRRFQPNH